MAFPLSQPATCTLELYILLKSALTSDSHEGRTPELPSMHRAAFLLSLQIPASRTPTLSCFLLPLTPPPSDEFGSIKQEMQPGFGLN